MCHFWLGTKVNPDSFQATEQQLVQHCETKVDADACKASLLVQIVVAPLGITRNWAMVKYQKKKLLTLYLHNFFMLLKIFVKANWFFFLNNKLILIPLFDAKVYKV